MQTLPFGNEGHFNSRLFRVEATITSSLCSLTADIGLRYVNGKFTILSDLFTSDRHTRASALSVHSQETIVTTLTNANRELFRRSADECFSSLDALEQSVQQRRKQSQDRWQPPQLLTPMPSNGRLDLTVGGDGDYAMNDWSFSQLCRLAGVSRDTITRLSPETASQAFRETLPSAEKPLQLLTTENTVRSIHGVAYTRLWDSELVATVREYATDFQPPQNAFNDATGLYAGEQDMFLFMIDPVGWIEINGEAFAPGFFAWNSEVGRRSLAS